MISVEKDFNNPPSKLIETNCQNKIKEAILEKNKYKFSECYNDKEIFEELKKIYNSKCGYCETDMNAGYKLQVEHYRPKKKVKEDETHQGYYWLAYEWSNLLLACPKCNQQGAKGNRFPIEGTRVDDHKNFLTNGVIDSTKCNPKLSPLFDEKPLFLNPEIDDVENHLIFLPNGEVKGVTDRGKVTIEICNLNNKEKRDNLILARKKIVDDMIAKIEKLLEDYLIKKIIKEDTFDYDLKKNIFMKIENGMNKDVTYSRVYYFLFNKFHIFILKKLEDTQKELIEKKFELYLNDEL